jgi:hypothetical protein
MRAAPFFYLVQLFATAESLDQLASDEVHYPAGTAEPTHGEVATQAAAFFCSDDHGLDEDEIVDGVVKVWGPFYLDGGSVLKVEPSETGSDTGWDVVA